MSCFLFFRFEKDSDDRRSHGNGCCAYHCFCCFFYICQNSSDVKTWTVDHQGNKQINLYFAKMLKPSCSYKKNTYKNKRNTNTQK